MCDASDAVTSTRRHLGLRDALADAPDEIGGVVRPGRSGTRSHAALRRRPTIVPPRTEQPVGRRRERPRETPTACRLRARVPDDRMEAERARADRGDRRDPSRAPQELAAATASPRPASAPRRSSARGADGVEVRAGVRGARRLDRDHALDRRRPSARRARARGRSPRSRAASMALPIVFDRSAAGQTTSTPSAVASRSAIELWYDPGDGEPGPRRRLARARAVRRPPRTARRRFERAVRPRDLERDDVQRQPVAPRRRDGGGRVGDDDDAHPGCEAFSRAEPAR